MISLGGILGVSAIYQKESLEFRTPATGFHGSSRRNGPNHQQDKPVLTSSPKEAFGQRVTIRVCGMLSRTHNDDQDTVPRFTCPQVAREGERQPSLQNLATPNRIWITTTSGSLPPLQNLPMRNLVVLTALTVGCLLVAIWLYVERTDDPISSQNRAEEFKNDLESNAHPTTDFSQLKLTTAEGQSISLEKILSSGKLVLVVLRGNQGYVCPFCSVQTQRLASRYQEIRDAGSEVIVVYPVRQESDLTMAKDLVLQAIPEKSKSQLPFPFVIDQDLEIVEQLGIRADLSKPATYILDNHGQVRFAYVGENPADRPSIDEILKQLQSIQSLP